MRCWRLLQQLRRTMRLCVRVNWFFTLTLRVPLTSDLWALAGAEQEVWDGEKFVPASEAKGIPSPQINIQGAH